MDLLHSREITPIEEQNRKASSGAYAHTNWVDILVRTARKGLPASAGHPTTYFSLSWQTSEPLDGKCAN